jgi:hypothetical protein
MNRNFALITDYDAYTYSPYMSAFHTSKIRNTALDTPVTSGILPPSADWLPLRSTFFARYGIHITFELGFDGFASVWVHFERCFRFGSQRSLYTS